MLDNDGDVDGDTLTVTQVALGTETVDAGAPLQGVYGALVLEADGSFTYELDNTLPATQALAQGATATEVFTYTVSDGQGGTVTQTLTVTVTGTNDVPVISADSDTAGAVAEPDESGTGRHLGPAAR